MLAKIHECLVHESRGWYKVTGKDSMAQVQRRHKTLLPRIEDFTYDERLRRLDLKTIFYRPMRGDRKSQGACIKHLAQAFKQ